MTQISQPWPGTAGGDASRARYDADEWTEMFRDMFNSDLNRGVLRNRGGELAGAVLGVTQFRMASGAALVRGRWYNNNANVDFAPAPPGAGVRQDRIVLSCSWNDINDATRDPAIQVAQTIRLIRLINAPAVTTTDGVLWEIPLYVIETNVAGTVSIISDDREFLLEAAGAAGLYDAYVCVRDLKAQGVDGGTFTAGAWRTRVINHEQADTAGICTIAGNQITLAAGTYRCMISAPAYQVDQHQTRLQNTTTAGTLLSGTPEQSRDSAYTSNRSFIAGRFTLAGAHVLEVQHQCSQTVAGAGFGSACHFTEEIYTIAEFWREV